MHISNIFLNNFVTHEDIFQHEFYIVLFSVYFEYQPKMIDFKCRIFLNSKLYSCGGIDGEVFRSHWGFSFLFCYTIEKKAGKRERWRERKRALVY